MSNNFVHLHAHSTFSLLDGIIQPKDLAKKAKSIGQQAVAITDHGSLAGWIKFYRACKAENIKPILGCEIYMDFTEEFSWLKKMNHLTVLCKDNTGYTNLIKLHNISTIKHGFKRVRVTYRELSEHRAGLIILSGCPNSIFAKMLENDKDPEEMFLRFQRDFGDDFYVELMNHGLDIEKRISPKLKNYAQKLGIKTVATNDTHYLKPEDAAPQYIAMLDAMKKSLGQPDLPDRFPSEFYLKTREQMIGFEEHELDCTVEIANKCNVTIEKYPNTIPDLDFDIDTSLIYPLEKLPKKYKDRYDYEYEIIKEANLIPYFKVVCDFLNFANKNDIFYGLGRGSIGGSLYAFLHGIHKVNPLRYDLYFSRFYNHGRKGGMPDIDTDFSKDGINDMYKYIKGKYGESNVVHIGISGKAGVKGALKMVCRTLGIDFQTSNNYSKMVPDKPENIYDILQNVDAKKLYDTDTRFKKIIDITSKTEGINFSYGTHASGVIISNVDLIDKIPLHKEDVELYVSYWDMEDTEWLGFLKFDFLTIDTLDIIKKTLKMIGRHTYDYIIHDIDPEVFKFIHNDSHVGLFQITSSGISQLTRAMKPDSIMELSHVVALYRPGPLASGVDKSYVNRKFKIEEAVPIHPLLEPILKDNYQLCINGESQILMGDLSNKKIKEISPGDVILDKNYNKQIVNKIYYNGEKELLKLYISDGRYLECTPDHKIYTLDGWINASDCLDKLIPRKINYRTDGIKVNKLECKLIGYLIGDGAISSKSNIAFVGSNDDILDDFEKTVNSYGARVVRYLAKNRKYVVRMAVYANNNIPYHKPSTVLCLMRELGLQGEKSGSKFIPDIILRADRESVIQFIASYWDCDGHVGEKLCFLKTISPTIAMQISELLFSIGIPNSIYCYDSYSYQINVYDAIAFDPIAKKMIKKTLFKNTKRGGQKTGFGRGIFPTQLINKICSDNNKTYHKASHIYGSNTHNSLPKNKKYIKRYMADRVLSYFNNKEHDDFLYYKVDKIEKSGEKKVYDLEISNTHSFIANSIPVHNCLYQEDVIKICIEIGGFSEVDADVIRKIIGKKKADEKELIQKMKEKFLHGAMQKGLNPELSEKLWSDMEAHSGYSFNRAHSVEYGYITYITAYLKMKHPAEFMAACLSMSKNELEVAKYLNECKRLGIKVSPPDIKKSKQDFTVNNGVILFSLNSIKNTGENFLAKILEWQTKGNLTLDNLILYVKPNKRVLESLIRSGALDCFIQDGMSINEHRGKLLYNLVQTDQLKDMQYAGDLFGETVSNMWEPLTDKAIMYDEKIFLGAFITNNPMDIFATEISRYYQLDLNEVPSFKISIAGIVDKITKKLDKNGNEFAIINIIQYNNVPVNLISYSRSWAEINNSIKVNNIIGVSGKVRDAGNFIIDKLITVME